MDVFSFVDGYIANLFSQEDEDLKSLKARNELAGIPNWEVSANQGALLQLLAKVRGAKRILEIGTLGAYSTVWLARSLPENGKCISIEINEAYAGTAKENINYCKLRDYVDVIIGNASIILQEMINNGAPPFDFIFIDADKPQYCRYLEQSLLLSRQGTIIIADNVIREGKVLDEHSEDAAVKGVQLFNKQLAATPEVMATIIQTVGVKAHDGMAIAVVK